MNGTPITWASIARFAKAGALLAFFLPWLTVSCQGTEVMSATGWGLVTASPDWASGGAPQGSEEPMALTATAALALGAWALFISFSNASAQTARMAMFLSLAAAAAAFAAPWEVMAGLEAAMESGGNQAPSPSPLSVEREIGGWVDGAWLCGRFSGLVHASPRGACAGGPRELALSRRGALSAGGW